MVAKKKSSKREDQRRLADYKVINCSNDRQPITKNELAAFVQAIEKNISCQFGVVRLCRLELDTLRPNPFKPGEKSNLIRFAAKLGRDSIVSSLLRGGTTPML
jgi:hypothetical protein